MPESFSPRFRGPPDQFPHRTAANTRRTSDEDLSYNCFGWAIGQNTIVSWTAGNLWAKDVPRNFRVESIIKFFESHGFEGCGQNGSIEYGIEKIAIYSDGLFATHAALQTETGKWSSKLGLEGEDVEHDDTRAIAGGAYGQVACFMKRPRGSAHVASAAPS